MFSPLEFFSILFFFYFSDARNILTFNRFFFKKKLLKYEDVYFLDCLVRWTWVYSYFVVALFFLMNFSTICEKWRLPLLIAFSWWLNFLLLVRNVSCRYKTSQSQLESRLRWDKRNIWIQLMIQLNNKFVSTNGNL